MEIKIETSARHIHLTSEDYKTLFGEKEPTKVKELTQGDFACEEFVKVIGPKSTLPKARLIIPFRKQSQLEISKTDSFSLGVEAPLRLSGDLPGANIKIVGSLGEIEKDIAIVAKRHLHLPPQEAKKIGLSNDDLVNVKVSGDRSLVFSNIVVRIEDTFSPSVHIDTDEANSAGISANATGELIFNS